MRSLEELVGLLTRLPGIGRKSALRVAWHLLKADPAFAETLAEGIRELRSKVRFCPICGGYTDAPDCPICDDPGREVGLLCVVEQPQDILTIEASKEYRGGYHVLGGVISPLDGVGPEDLRFDSLLARVAEGRITEVVVATNPTVEGDTTALYLKRALEREGVTVSRLATGIPVGGDLEYADRLTLARSFRGRTRL